MPRPRDLRRLSAHAAPAAAMVALLLAFHPAGAVLYKWVDANGRVTYSDQPPSGNVKAEIVGATPPPADPSAMRDLANQEADLKKAQSQRADELKKAAKTRSDQLQLQQDCADARVRLRLYASDQPIAHIDEKGDQVFVDDATRQQTRARLESQIRERCPPG